MASESAATDASKEDSAQRQNSNRLPERDQAQAKERGQEPIPQVHHQFAADGDKQHNPDDRRGNNKNHFHPSWSHVGFLMLRKLHFRKIHFFVISWVSEFVVDALQ
ncbi:MAG: hypothetical protein WAL71_10340, partial [Terriglobales bacterium]